MAKTTDNATDPIEPTEENTRPEASTDPNLPVTSESDETPADVIGTRTVDTDARPIFEAVAAPAPAPTDADVITDLGPAHVLNATPGADPTRAPDVESQRTGKVADTVFRAPGMTRGSAINQLEISYGELVNKLHDFDHDTDGLPADIVALIDFVKSRSGAKA
jgi:hypothetical protein